MAKNKKKVEAITSMEEDFAQWYTDVVKKAELIGYESGHYTVAVENAYVKDWAEARLWKLTEKILSMLEGGVVSVSFVVDQSTQIPAASEEADKYPAPSLELLPMPEDPKAAELTEICNDYLLDPAGIEYSKEQLQELISMKPDPRVLRLLLPMVTSFESAKMWCKKPWDEANQNAKRNVLKKYGIYNPEREKIAINAGISLELINQVRQEFPEKMSDQDKNYFISRVKDLAEE